MVLTSSIGSSYSIKHEIIRNQTLTSSGAFLLRLFILQRINVWNVLCVDVQVKCFVSFVAPLPCIEKVSVRLDIKVLVNFGVFDLLSAGFLLSEYF